MKNRQKDYEMLSAYIDGELQEDEIKKTEEKLAIRADLQKKLDDLERIKKLTKSSVKIPAESPYFETRVFANLSRSKSRYKKFKTILPAFSFAVLAVLLMVFLKLNPTILQDLFETQKINIADFYKQNLKPLLLTAGLTNEDIFNFALNKQLPLDKNNKQYIKLGYDQNGKEFFEIKHAGLTNEENTFEDFVSALKLNSQQKHQMDSILDSYADEMEDQILINDKNTVAINPEIWNYNKAIFADIMSFAENACNEEFVKIMPAGYRMHEKPVIDKMVKEIKSRTSNKYIFFTPDSIFMDNFEFDKEKFEDEMKEMEKELQKDMEDVKKELKDLNIEIRINDHITNFKLDSLWDDDFNVNIDSNSCRVKLSRVIIPKIDMPDLDSIAAQIERSLKHIPSFTFNNRGMNEFQFRINSEDSAALKNLDIKIKLPNLDSIMLHQSPKIDSIMRFNMKYLDSIPNLGKFNFFLGPDSFKIPAQFFSYDSLNFNQEKFEKQMKEFEREMNKLRERMDKFQDEYFKDQKEIKKKSKKEPIEI
ncbi:MAG: anti-sigma factor family protein [Ignavibacteria bacterium]